jgi:hypothetical protein
MDRARKKHERLYTELQVLAALTSTGNAPDTERYGPHSRYRNDGENVARNRTPDVQNMARN